MRRCKAPEILRSEAYLECTLQRRKMRGTPQMGVFQQPAEVKLDAMMIDVDRFLYGLWKRKL
jgi:hypothetical protein